MAQAMTTSNNESPASRVMSEALELAIEGHSLLPSCSCPQMAALASCGPSLPVSDVADKPPLVHVTDVEVIGAYELRLSFEDGTVGDVGFDDREWTGVFEPLRDPQRFERVSVEAGTPDDGLDMAPEPLYAEARRHLVSRPAVSA
jgi:hypothetical protein